MHIKIDRFSGIRPIQNNKKLSNAEATKAVNTKIEDGDVRSYRPELLELSTPHTAPVYSFHRFNDGATILFDLDADITGGPVPDDESERIYFSMNKVSYKASPHFTTGWPKVTNRALAASTSGHNTWPTNVRELGVPAPTSVPLAVVAELPDNIISSVSISADSGVAIVNSVFPHGLSTGNRVSVSNTSIENLDGGEYTITKVDASSFTLNDTEIISTSSSGSWKRVYKESEIKSRVYVSTNVTDWGEESAPSDVSLVVDVGDGSIVSVTTATSPSMSKTVDGLTGTFNWTKKRIYRSFSGDSGADLYFVGEINASQAVFTDGVDAASIGEILPSNDWNLPEPDLDGLLLMPNGFMVGFSRNELCFSVPDVPYAWPEIYKKRLDSPITGIAQYGYNLVICTKTATYVGSGADPESFSYDKIEGAGICLYKRSMVSAGSGVFFVSNYGLELVSNNGSRNVTKSYISRRDWVSSYAANAVAATFYDGKYFLSTPIGTTIFEYQEDKGLVITKYEPENGHLIYGYLLDARIDGTVDVSDDGILYLSSKFYNTPTDIMKFDTGYGVPKQYQWVSKTFSFSRQVSFGAAEVFIDRTPYSVDGDGVGVSGYKFALYLRVKKVGTANTETIFAKTFSGTSYSERLGIFRLPPGQYNDVSIEVYGNVELQGIHIAETVEELKGLSNV